MVDDSISLKDNLYNLFFNTGSILAGGTDTLINEEFKETARYSDVLSAIASGRSSLNDIAEKVRMQTGTVSFYLSNMIRVGLIKKETPYGSSNNKKSIYTITNGLFRFHYQFVIPNINMINFGKGKDILDMVVIHSLSRYMGLEWEQICISYMFASFNVTRDPFLYNDLQRWWGGSTKQKKQIEIDMMSTHNDKALFGECKWTNDKVDIDILDNLIDKCSQFDYKSKTWYLFSKSGFEESLIEKANKESNIHLISLNDVYSL
ncbi:ATP-binding protein [Bullifex porci]